MRLYVSYTEERAWADCIFEIELEVEASATIADVKYSRSDM